MKFKHGDRVKCMIEGVEIDDARISIDKDGTPLSQNLEELVEEVSKKHAEILDSFAKAYMASRWKDYFSRQKNIDFRRVELCHQIKSPTEHVYWFRLKKGRLARRQN